MLWEVRRTVVAKKAEYIAGIFPIGENIEDEGTVGSVGGRCRGCDGGGSAAGGSGSMSHTV